MKANSSLSARSDENMLRRTLIDIERYGIRSTSGQYQIVQLILQNQRMLAGNEGGLTHAESSEDVSNELGELQDQFNRSNIEFSNSISEYVNMVSEQTEEIMDDTSNLEDWRVEIENLVDEVQDISDGLDSNGIKINLIFLAWFLVGSIFVIVGRFIEMRQEIIGKVTSVLTLENDGNELSVEQS